MSDYCATTDQLFARSSSPGAAAVSSRLWACAGVVLLVALVGVLYYPSFDGGFVFDDDHYLAENPSIHASDGLWRFWFAPERAAYSPLTYSVFWVEWRCFATNPTGYHVVNIFLHIVDCLLLWLVFREMRLPGAYFAALLFAVHPVNVESVAWIAQLKNVLSLAFLLASIYCYFCAGRASRHFAESIFPAGSRSWLVLSFLMFLAAVLGKGSTVVMPALLLVLLAWRRNLTVKDVLRLLPFMVVALAFAFLNKWLEIQGEYAPRDVSFVERLLGAGCVSWFYLYKTIWPSHLIFFYPAWQIDPAKIVWWTPLIAAVGCTIILAAFARRSARPLWYAWLFYGMALAPVLGFVDVGYMHLSLVADHYQHIALTGVLATIAAGWRVLHQRLPSAARWISFAAAVAVVAMLSVLTWNLNKDYRDAPTLYKATIVKNPDCWFAYYNLGTLTAKSGDPAGAIPYFNDSLRLNPKYASSVNNLASAFYAIGRPGDAIELYEKTLKVEPVNPEVHFFYGILLQQLGRSADAMTHFETALKQKPNYAAAENELGNAILAQNRLEDALTHYRRAVEISPDYPEALCNEGIALRILGRPQEALEPLEKAVQLKPDFLTPHLHLLWVYAELNRDQEAVATAQKALAIAQAADNARLVKQLEEWIAGRKK